MISILIAVVVVAVVLWLASWIIGYLPAPNNVKNVLLIVVGVLLLLWFLQQVGIV